MTKFFCVCFQYQMPYDEERDWPQVEREDEVDDAGDQTQKPPLALARVILFLLIVMHFGNFHE